MDGCAAHSAGSRSGWIYPAFRQETLSPPPLAADLGARGSRHLRPAAAVLGRVEHVDERSLQRGHANESAGMTLLQETAGRTPRSPQRCRQQYSDELRASELEGPQAMPRKVGEPARNRVGLAVK